MFEGHSFGDGGPKSAVETFRLPNSKIRIRDLRSPNPLSTETKDTSASAGANSHARTLCRFDQILETACPVQKKIVLWS